MSPEETVQCVRGHLAIGSLTDLDLISAQLLLRKGFLSSNDQQPTLSRLIPSYRSVPPIIKLKAEGKETLKGTMIPFPLQGENLYYHRPTDVFRTTYVWILSAGDLPQLSNLQQGPDPLRAYDRYLAPPS